MRHGRGSRPPSSPPSEEGPTFALLSLGEVEWQQRHCYPFSKGEGLLSQNRWLSSGIFVKPSFCRGNRQDGEQGWGYREH